MEDINVDGRTILTLILKTGRGDVNCSRVEQNEERLFFVA